MSLRGEAKGLMPPYEPSYEKAEGLLTGLTAILQLAQKIVTILFNSGKKFITFD